MADRTTFNARLRARSASRKDYAAEIEDHAARRLRTARLAARIAESLDRLVQTEQKVRERIGYPTWTDRLKAR